MPKATLSATVSPQMPGNLPSCVHQPACFTFLTEIQYVYISAIFYYVANIYLRIGILC